MSNFCPICKGSALVDYRTVNNYNSLQCLGCNHIFVVDVQALAFDKLYSEDFYHNYMSGLGYDQAYKKYLIRDFERKVSLIKKNFDTHIQILEVGSGPGYFADLMIKEGYKIIACELTEGAQTYAYQHGINVRILNEDISKSCSISGMKFDLIVSWAVVEHIVNPKEYIQLLKSYLKPRGALMLDTGIIDPIILKLDKGYTSWLFPPLHLHVFSSKSLPLLLTNSGFEVTRFWPKWNREPLFEMIKLYTRLFILKYFKKSKSPYDNPGVIGYIGLIYAKCNGLQS
jgi:SAM-dependent methyltransferase